MPYVPVEYVGQRQQSHGLGGGCAVDDHHVVAPGPGGLQRVDGDAPEITAFLRGAVLAPRRSPGSRTIGVSLGPVHRVTAGRGSTIIALDDRPGGGARVTLFLPRGGRRAPGPTPSTEETP